MYPASAAFKNALEGNHTVVVKVEVWNGDLKLRTLDVDSGQVTISATSTVRRVCEIHLVTTRDANNLVPDNDFDILSPFGNELKLYRGIKFDNGSIEYVPLGVFVITDISINDSNDGVEINVAGEDRSIRVSRAKWLEPYQLTIGTLELAITNLLTNRYPDVVVNFPATNVTVEDIVIGAEGNNDPWADAVYICQLVGFDLYFDVNGIAVMKQFPTLDGAVIAATYIEGEQTLITSLDRAISSKETYNGVVYTVQGTGVTTPVRVTVWDEDSTSPTYRYGAFGQVPTFIETSLITNTTAATNAAIALLDRYRGAQELISWSSLADPTLDVNDVLYIKSNGAKVDRVVIIDELTVPLGPSENLEAQARVVRVVSANEVIEIGQ